MAVGGAIIEPSTAAAQTSAPSPYADREQVLGLLKRCLADARQNTARHARDKQDLQNLFMKRGGPDHQWTVWDSSRETYVPRPYAGEGALPEWFPRPSSNLFSNKIDGIAALLNQSQPALEWKPSTDDDGDRAGASVIENAMPVLFDEIGYATLKPQINKLVTLTDKVAVVVYFDNDEKYGVEDIPAAQCAECQQYYEPKELADGQEGGCPECGGALQTAIDPQTGQTLGVSYPKGKLCAEKFTSFETSLPRSAKACDEQQLPWILTHSRYSKEDALAQWAKLRESLKEGGSGSGGGDKTASQAYADQARNLSSPRADASSSSGAASAQGPLIYRLWHDPIDDGEYTFPEGLYCVCYEETLILEAGPLPLQDDDGRPVKNVVLRTYAHAPASPWGKPPADDLVPIQTMHNLALALAFLILMHNAAPRTFIPSTVTLLDDLINQPGANVGYRSLNGEKPHTEPGIGFPEALKWFLEYLKAQFDELSNLNAILQGARPEGDPTLGEVQMLTERGLAAFREALDSLIDFEKRLARMLLWTARQTAWAPRFRQVQGQNGEWDVEQFTALDLTGKVDVTCEPASAWPRSIMLQNVRLNAAFKLGILNPQDPEVQASYLSLNDLTEFKASMDVDRKQIARQLDAWQQAFTPADIAPPQQWWNLPMHLFLKSAFLKTEEAEAIARDRAPVFQAMLQHVEQIRQLLQPPAAPAAPTDAAKPPDGRVLDRAVRGGALHPVGAPKPGGDAMERAVRSGALRPVPPAADEGAGASRAAAGSVARTAPPPSSAAAAAVM